MHMAGYNKKAAVDAKRGKLFTKMSKLVTMAVKEAGGDPTHSTVQTAIERAKKVSTPKDIIDKAIKKGSDKDAAALESVTYEGYGPGGVGLIIEAVTDNRNRTAQEVRHAFSSNGFSMGVAGSVAWGFSKDAQSNWSVNPGTEIKITDEQQAELEKLIESLNALDDVNDVFTNLAASDNQADKEANNKTDAQ